MSISVEWENRFEAVVEQLNNNKKNVLSYAQELLKFSQNKFGEESKHTGIAYALTIYILIQNNTFDKVEALLGDLQLNADLQTSLKIQDNLSFLVITLSAIIDVTNENLNIAVDKIEAALKLNLSNSIITNYFKDKLADYYLCLEEFKNAEKLFLEQTNLEAQFKQLIANFFINYEEVNKNIFTPILEELKKNNFIINQNISLWGLACLNASAQLEIRTNDFEAAIESLELGLELTTKIYGEKNPLVYQTIFFYADYLETNLKLEDQKQALEYLLSLLDKEINLTEYTICLEKLIPCLEKLNFREQLPQHYQDLNDHYSLATGFEYLPIHSENYDIRIEDNQDVRLFEHELGHLRAINYKGFHPQILHFLKHELGRFNFKTYTPIFIDSLRSLVKS